MPSIKPLTVKWITSVNFTTINTGSFNFSLCKGVIKLDRYDPVFSSPEDAFAFFLNTKCNRNLLSSFAHYTCEQAHTYYCAESVKNTCKVRPDRSFVSCSKMHCTDHGRRNKRGNLRINATLGRIRVTTVPVENSKSYSECVSVALDIQHAKRMRRIVMCVLSGCTIFFHVFI